MQFIKRDGSPPRHQRRGTVVAQVAVCSTIMVGMAALVLDIGVMYTSQTELQVSADAAALAAAAELAGTQEGDPHALAVAAADEYAGLNTVRAASPMVLDEDVEFGRAVLYSDNGKFEFEPDDVNSNAVRVTVKRKRVKHDGEPDTWVWIEAPFFFAPLFGQNSQALHARAAAVLLPRDIAVVIDLSNSMNYDSQLRYWDRDDGGYSNLRDVWCALDGPEPAKPYIPASADTVDETEYFDDTGPTIGVMSVWGDALVPDSYDVATDPGLYYLPRGEDWSGDAEVEQLLVDQGYNDWERWAILTNETQGYLTAQQTDAGGFSNRVIWQENVSEGRDRITVYLTSDDSEATPALSHMVVSLPADAWAVAQSTATSQGNHLFETVSPDPKTGYSGIKFDELSLGENGVVETEWFSFEVSSSCSIQDTDIVCKAGNGFAAAHQDFESVYEWDLTRWQYRVAAVLGLTHWDSGMDGTGGDDDGMIEGSGELDWIPKPPFRVDWSWTSYINWVRSSARQDFQYRYGLKTFTNFLLDNEPGFNETNNLWATPQQPMRAVKDAVWTLANVIDSLDSLDQTSLEIFDGEGRHEVDLSDDIWQVPNLLYERQTGHYDRYTNIGGGLYHAISELTYSPQTRSSAAKVIVLMSDGSPNRYDQRCELADIDELDPPEGDPESWSNAKQYAESMARVAAKKKMRIYSVSVGYSADQNLMEWIATTGNGEHFYASGNPQEYTAQLEEIFRTLGGKRPVALIE